MIPQVIAGKRAKESNYSFLNEMGRNGVRNIIISDAVYQYSNTKKNICEAHLKCVSRAIVRNWPIAIIAEDDIRFTSTNSYMHWFGLMDSLPPDWDIFLSGVYGAVIDSVISKDVARLKRFSGLHLYAINSKFFPTILQADRSKNLDSWIGLYANANIYCSMPMVAIQHSGYSEKDGRFTDHSDILSKHNFPIYTGK